MKQKLCGIFFIFFVILLFTACISESAGTDVTTEPVSTELSEPEKTVDEIFVRSLLSEGNNFRLKRVLDKISSGEDVTVGFIGGSITEGFNASAGTNYATLVTSYLDKTYSDGTGKVRCLNAGLSGTPSMLGLIRAEDDLLYAQPDLIFIEFAVNDAQSFTDKQAFEGLVRKCLLQENEPAVVLLYSVTSNGYTCQNDMALTGFFYNLPSVSVRDAIMPEIESGAMTWADWSNDEVHPHTQGHELYSQFIIHLIETLADEETDPEYHVPTDTKFSRDWSNMKLYDRESIKLLSIGDFEETSAHPHFRNSYSCNTSSSGNEGITFEVSGRTLFLVYKASKASSYGTAEVLVDGEVVAHLSAYTPDGWNNPVTQLIYSEKESAVHQITIRMQEGDEDKNFDLLCIGAAE